MEDIINQIKEFAMVASLLSEKQVKEIGEDKLAEYVAEGNKYQLEHSESENRRISRIEELDAKAVIEGLTDDEKKEYKELRGL